MAATLAAIHVLRNGPVFAAMVIALAAEIIRMATGTVRLELRVRPDIGCRVARVAIHAREVAAVIERLITQGRMSEYMGNPDAGVMAVVTLSRRHEVTRVSSRGDDAIMAERAGANDLRVIDRHYGAPCRCGVAVLANVRRQRMRRVLSSRVRAVMAAYAIACNVGVVEVGRDPRHSRMAVVTIVTAGNVRRMLAGRNRAVVTG